MSTFVGQPGPDGGGVDLVAVARDAELLDRLAVRARVPSDDVVATLLAALAADVDEGLDAALVPDEDDPRVATLVDAAPAPVVPLSRPPRRGHGRRTTTVAVVVAATLSMGGVAAAVTGDPLAPVKGLATAVGWSQPKADLPEQAAQVAKVNHAMVGLRAMIAHGQLDGVRARIDAIRAMLADPSLTPGQRKGLEKRLAALEAALARAEAKAAAGQGHKPDTPGRVGGTAPPGKSGGGRDEQPAAPSGKGSGHDKGSGQDKGSTSTKGSSTDKSSRSQPDGGTTTQAPADDGTADDDPTADGSGATTDTQSPTRGKGQGAGSPASGRSRSTKG